MQHPNGNVVTPGLRDLSPFELKDELIRYAEDYTQSKAATNAFLNAGRGNPNWTATTPRESFFLLGQFALQECKRVWDEPDLGGMPHARGSADRLRDFLSGAPDTAGARLLRKTLAYAVGELGFQGDAFVHELVDSVVGDNYPTPDRMLVHGEKIVERYIKRELCAGHPPEGKFDLFAVEGGTAAMCYVFKSLMENKILHRGDAIALGTPIFTPYVEMPHLNDFDLRTIEVKQNEMIDGRHLWQYGDAELAKLEDPKVKAFFIVNPSNPASYAMTEEAYGNIVRLVREKRQDLIILTDDVYGTFSDGFRTLATDLPQNTILVYSFSKYFGCTGWRLGVVALHEDNVIDKMLARLPKSDKLALDARYRPLTPDSSTMKFIDRMVADSRDVALNHTAGLSLPQQAQMTLFALFALLDEGDTYKKRCRKIIQERWEKLLAGLGVSLPEDPLRVGYYADLDLEAWGLRTFGEEFTNYIKEHHDPLELVIGLARRFGTVLLNGGGFDGPPWSARVSLANLNADEYEVIGRNLREVALAGVERWRASKAGGQAGAPGKGDVGGNAKSGDKGKNGGKNGGGRS